MTLPAGNGNSDSFFISEVRRILRDQPAYTGGAESTGTDGTKGTLMPGSSPFRTQRAPVMPNSVALSAPGGPYTLAYDTNVTAGPTVPPVISDAGAGVLGAGNYQIVYNYTYGPAVTPDPLGPATTWFSPPSNILTLAANHNLSIAALTGIPAGVTWVNLFYLQADGLLPGYFNRLQVNNGSTPPGVINNSQGDGVMPNVNINTDTGEIIFILAPPTGTLSLRYQASRFSDQAITDALYEGMRSMYPDFWQPAIDTSIQLNANTFEYTLPAVFQDPRVVLMRVEIRYPSGIIQYTDVKDWDYTQGNDYITFYSLRTPGSTLRLTYNAQYTALADLETQIMHLPVYYAVARLLADAEAQRSRQDELVPVTQEGGSQPGNAERISDFWMNKYESERQRLARNPAIRTHVFRRSRTRAWPWAM